MTSYIRFSKTATLTEAKRMKNSRNGNPRYAFKFATPWLNSDILAGKSASDAGWVYSDNFENHVGKVCRFQFHFTNSGKTIIDNVKMI